MTTKTITTKTITRLLSSVGLLLLLNTFQTSAQTVESLRKNIEQILSTKNAVVGVAIMDNNGNDIASVHGERHFPMQSVFKFHIGLAMLSEIDKGKFSLDQTIDIKKKDLLPDLYSPLRDKYPNGGALTIAELLRYMVAQSDNVGCEVLLRLLGGPQAVETYFVQHQFKDISIKINEETMQNNWDLQFQNWTTPKAANEVLKAFYENKNKDGNKNDLLSPKSYEFMWSVMKETETGKDRLKGLLPAGTVVAHKTGSSGVHKTTGITAAVNDIGIVFLPNGKHFFISVFVSESKEDTPTNEKIIADIGKAAWDFFAAKQ